MDVIEAIHTRRSIRSYTPQPVERELIEHDLGRCQALPVQRTATWTFNVVEGVERISAFGDEAFQYARDNHPDEPGSDGQTDRIPGLLGRSGSDHHIRAGPRLLSSGPELDVSAHARGLGTCWVGSPMFWLRTA